MIDPHLIARTHVAFRDDAAEAPPLTLRGGNALDDYSTPLPFEAAADTPTDAYLEQHTFCGLGYLDARSWRHYLPRLIEYTVHHPDDPAMVTEALVRSLRPPDRYPPRLGSLTNAQELVLRSFLEALATGQATRHMQDEAQQALEEWWWPNPRSRPTPAELQALRDVPTTYREAIGEGYKLLMPDTLASSGVRDIPSESRRVQTWGGCLCGDVHAIIAVNVLTDATRSAGQVLGSYASFFSTRELPKPADVPGARSALRTDAVVFPESPADPHAIVLVVAEAAAVISLTIRAYDRPDVRTVISHVASSFDLT